MKSIVWLMAACLLALEFCEASDEVVNISADDLTYKIEEEKCACPFEDGKCCEGFCCPKGAQCGPNKSCYSEQKEALIDLPAEVSPVNLRESELQAEADINIRICPDKRSKCGTNQTCCLTHDGKHYSCCSYSHGTCCADRRSCCPSHTKCNPHSGMCDPAGVQSDDNSEPYLNNDNTMVPKVSLTEGEKVGAACKDNKTTCAEGETCCQARFGMGCCPLPNAVCCSDKRHCCNKGQTCDSNGMCKSSEESFELLTPQDSKPLMTSENDNPEAELIDIANSDALKKLEDLLKWSATLTDYCPGSRYQCRPGTTCCMRADGKYNCCSQGQQCSAATNFCGKSGDTCPGSRYKCRPGTTCCKRADGKYNCCSQGQQCSAATNFCGKSGDTCPGSRYKCRPGTTCCKRLDGKYNCCSQGQQCSAATNFCGRRESYADLIFRIPNAGKVVLKGEIVVCHNPRYHCQDGQTCCPRPDGTYGCCPFGYNACCPGGYMCCPLSYPHCSGNMCYRSVDAIFGIQKMQSSPATNLLDSNERKCHDKKTKCSHHSKCCKKPDGKFNCCSKGTKCSKETNWCAKNVCPNSKVICPHGTKCCKKPDGKFNCCSKGTKCSKETNWCAKNVCPNSKVICPHGTKCCKKPDGKFNCCSKGTKCSKETNWCAKKNFCPNSKVICPHHSKCCKKPDGKFNCCSKGTKCSKETNWCAKKNFCPNSKVICPHGTKCCKKPDGKFNCCSKGTKCSKETNWCAKKNICPHSNFVCPHNTTCCKRPNMKYNCCPKGKECSNETNWCRKPHTTCPGTNFSCKFNTTCCKQPSGRLSCCKNGTECSSKTNWCITSAAFDLDEENDSSYDSSESLTSENKQGAGITCPGGKTTCLPGTTCCKTPDGYGCCPYPNATCCIDGKHCCPNGMTCDLAEGRCLRQFDSLTLPMAVKEEGFPTNAQVKDSTMCPDEHTSCSKKKTCCLLENGKYGCCKFKQATCCADKKNCCPSGYSCNPKNNDCIKKVESEVENMTPLHH